MHRALSLSNWDYDGLTVRIAQDLSRALSTPNDGGLFIDESAFSKKGKQSVGVARQWNGRLGKVDNCQVGVFASFGVGQNHSLVGHRLYLPKNWTEDRVRMEQAGVPQEHQVFKTKDQIALDLVKQARLSGVGFKWVGADAGYGKNLWFVQQLEQMGETFVVDWHSKRSVYTQEPKLSLPDPKSKRGRPSSKQVSDIDPVPICKLKDQLEPSQWHQVTLREGSKGPLVLDVYRQKVWMWDKKATKLMACTLIMSREPRGHIKYSLSNAPEQTPTKQLLYMQRQRFLIELSFQDGKSHLGMADYQVRSWRGWHHHMALVSLAMLFVLEEKLVNEEETPLLSVSDVVELLDHFLPKKQVSDEDVFAQIERRHRQRYNATKHHQKKYETQEKRLSSPL